MSGEATASVTAALFGLDGFVVLGAADAGGELQQRGNAAVVGALAPRCHPAALALVMLCLGYIAHGCRR